MQDINIHLNNFRDIKIVHCNRTVNKLVNRLAKRRIYVFLRALYFLNRKSKHTHTHKHEKIVCYCHRRKILIVT